MQVFNNFQEMQASQTAGAQAQMSVFNAVPQETEQRANEALRSIRSGFAPLLDAINPAHHDSPDSKATLAPIYEQYKAAEEALNAAGRTFAAALGQ